MKFIDDIPIWGDPVDEGALSQIKTCKRTAAAVALMGDHHKGYAVPIGGVVAYEDKISPSGVGYDIACGNKATFDWAVCPRCGALAAGDPGTSAEIIEPTRAEARTAGDRARFSEEPDFYRAVPSTGTGETILDKD